MKIKPCSGCPMFYQKTCDIPLALSQKLNEVKPNEVKMFTALNMQCKKYKNLFKPGDHVLVTLSFPQDEYTQGGEEEFNAIFSKWMGGKHSYKAKLFIYHNEKVPYFGKGDIIFLTPDHQKHRTGFIKVNGFTEICPKCGKPKGIKYPKDWTCDIDNNGEWIDCDGNLIEVE